MIKFIQTWGIKRPPLWVAKIVTRLLCYVAAVTGISLQFYDVAIKTRDDWRDIKAQSVRGMERLRN